MTAYDPLHDTAKQSRIIPGPLETELSLARKLLDSIAAWNIHDHNTMVRAAASLDYRLRALLAAVETERGESR
ncbi:hypothetical protein [Streptomyces acidiscabies]|uniref:Uncharacterized protein n=1 Tax=Streptomyces acidiscabies TaxID=42234 RepID=A0AAP6EML1_9ACTN|nr:hypothetical protein [Streptomyces acidiscabies]MBZ3918182.1 hypothetical protein [Streptomyces acidiscabies]MDX2967281.1 hypothetical protein [Streptomyces acidiscabies]MDX3016751.1 hypothetical protein [Streptomyces acidiscabies]MDX3794054.1 hypothetical protein [Streptomyces acidiscabies]